jgi:hypothetical protein
VRGQEQRSADPFDVVERRSGAGTVAEGVCGPGTGGSRAMVGAALGDWRLFNVRLRAGRCRGGPVGGRLADSRQFQGLATAEWWEKGEGKGAGSRQSAPDISPVPRLCQRQEDCERGLASASYADNSTETTVSSRPVSSRARAVRCPSSLTQAPHCTLPRGATPRCR